MNAIVAALAFALGPVQEEPRAEPYAELAWPGWRGPEHDGVSRESGWRSEPKTTPLWRFDAGPGHSSFAVAGERLLTLGFDDDGQVDVLWCLDPRTGEPRWAATYPATLDALGHGGGTHSTPCITGERVLVQSRRGEVRAFALDDGELLWKVDLAAAHGVEPTDYGYGGSPVVSAGRVLVNASRTFALDPATGDVLWASADRAAMYSTPTPFRHRGTAALAVFSKEGLSILARADGAERAHLPWRKGTTTVNASSPVVVDPGKLFLSSAYDHGGALVDASGEAPAIVWEYRAMRTKMTGCVLWKGRLFGFDEAILKCLDLTGREVWRKRGLGMGALSASDGRLIVQGGRGELVIVDAEAESYAELARTRVFPRGRAFWATPVLSGGRVFCRSGEGEVVALDHRP